MSAALVSRDALPSSRPPSPSSPSGVHARERRVNDALLLADLPLSVTLLLKLLSDAPDQVALIARAVEKNPLLADSILFLARAVLGPREACGNLAEAIVVLGARTIGLLAAAAGAAGMLDREVSTTYFMGRPRTMAALCRRVAPIVGMSARDASLCGLLCDVGEAILVRQRRRRAFDDLVQQVGFDHAALGECVLGAWGASEEVALAVRFHHDVACAYDAGPRVARLVAVVRFCDAVARRTSDAPGSRAESLDPITREESAEHLPVDASSMGALCGAVREVCAPYVAQEDDLGIHEAALPQELEAPCVTCGASSSMALCPCCEGTLCDAHGATGHGWCRACEETYRAERGARSESSWRRLRRPCSPSLA
jgi:HD-like signal output (HDOD) protein